MYKLLRNLKIFIILILPVIVLANKNTSLFQEIKNEAGTYSSNHNYKIIVDNFGYGFHPPSEKEWNQFESSVLPFQYYSNLPTKYDNSVTQWFPPIGSQGLKGSCVVWSFVYYAKTFQEAKENNWDLSDCKFYGYPYFQPDTQYFNKIMNPDFVYHLGNDGLDNGISAYKVAEILGTFGSNTWATMPYQESNSTDWPTEQAFKEAPKYLSTNGLTSIIINSDSSLNQVKKLLTDNVLLTIIIDAKSFSSLTSEYLWTSDSYKPNSLNHATTIVGYDDEFGPYSENGVNKYGAFKIANSGGTNWGDNGFYYISYKCMQEKIKYAQYIEDIVGYSPKLITTFNFQHSDTKDCALSFLIQQNGSIKYQKIFWDGYSEPIKRSFPDYNLTFDISEFHDDFVNAGDTILMKIQDYGGDDDGILNYFIVCDCNDSNRIYFNTEIPKAIKNSSTSTMKILNTDSDYYALGIDYDSENAVCYPDYPDTINVSIQNRGERTNIKIELDDKTNYKTTLSQTFIDREEIVDFQIMFNTSNPGNYSTTLSVNIENDKTYILPIDRTVIPAPKISLDIYNKDVSMDENDSIYSTINISNIGGSDLIYNAQLEFLPLSESLKNLSSDKNWQNQNFEYSHFEIDTLYRRYITANRGFDFINDRIYFITENELRCKNIITGESEHLFFIHKNPFGLDFDGSLFWIGSSNCTLYGYDISGKLKHEIKISLPDFSSFSFTGKHFIASSLSGSKIVIFDHDGQVLSSIDNIIPDEIKDIEWRSEIPESPLLILSRNTNVLYFFNVTDEKISLMQSINLKSIYPSRIKFYRGQVWITTINKDLYRLKLPSVVWAKLNNYQGTIPTLQSDDLQILYSSANLNIGNTQCNLKIRCNDPSASEIENTFTLNILNDKCAPSKINDLRIVEFGRDSIAFKWTATGDNGHHGISDSYDIRCSKQPITEDNFYTAQKMVNNIIPKYPQLTDYFAIDSLEEFTKYFIAIKVVDEMGNTSEISNNDSITTKSPIYIKDNSFVFTEIFGQQDDSLSPEN